MKLPIRALPIMLALLSALPLATSARAQDVTGERVRLAIEMTDQRIEIAQSLVAESGSAQAQLEVDASLQLQGQAKSAFEQALTATGEVQLRLLRQALDLTFRARARADRAIALVRGLPDPERVIAQIERTHELIERVRDRIEECKSERARSLLRVAIDMQARARAAVHEGRYLAALQLTLSARERALRALRMCNLEDNLQEASERALQRTDEVLDRAREVVSGSGSEPARELLGRAQRMQNEAWSQFRAEHFEACLRLTQAARNLAHRAIRLAGGAR
jgi:hypothetical protein